ncbi:unnamed protein product [Darwinula stevensoni]|uniref:Fringe-like glycosyltransferase domain-containing protein n=1 Tax=Darwinula stevensoni TaxID=69355 RepID=A0A7R8X4P0_9CRUS|nr:unnamed protein product [Darwinula stevensoni]CAG0883739.1 unnamed protein product [Darwinula stevensoni]
MVMRLFRMRLRRWMGRVIFLVVVITTLLFLLVCVATNDDPRQGRFVQDSKFPARSVKSQDLNDVIAMDHVNNHLVTTDKERTPTVAFPPILKDVFISVKTTAGFHRTRLDVVLKTWFTMAKDQTWIFTDVDDPYYQEKTGNHMVNTNCSSSHSRKALNCKMSVEFDTYLRSDKKWFCHFDDDNYVNIPRLGEVLELYDSGKDWYLGKTSIKTPLEFVSKNNGKDVSFWFATGGAGFCLSRSLALKMVPHASGGRFIRIGEKIRLPDDVTMGYIIEHLLGKNLTVIEGFHSHLEPMQFLNPDSFHEQITFGYNVNGTARNVLRIDGFSTLEDPTRFLSLHCFLFPEFAPCPR